MAAFTAFELYWEEHGVKACSAVPPPKPWLQLLWEWNLTSVPQGRQGRLGQWCRAQLSVWNSVLVEIPLSPSTEEKHVLRG